MLEYHGSVSSMVNFHALEVFFKTLGGLQLKSSIIAEKSRSSELGLHAQICERMRLCHTLSSALTQQQTSSTVDDNSY